MKFFTKLFSTKNGAKVSDNQMDEKVHDDLLNDVATEKLIIDNTLTDHNIMTDNLQNNAQFRQLFQDEMPPLPESIISEMKSTNVATFLNCNYFSLGLADGYEYHSHDMLMLAKRKIKADFIICLDKAIEMQQFLRLKIKNSMVGLSQIDEVRIKLENKLYENEESIGNLKTQKELSVDDNGWVMAAIHDYHKGFIRGINDWLSSEELLTMHSNF